MTSNIQSAVEAMLADCQTPEAKKKLLLETAARLLAANAEVKRKAVEAELACEKKSAESQKAMEKFLQITKDKDLIKNYNKKMLEHLQELKKKGEHTALAHKETREEYQKKFEELMKKLEEDYNYDENKCKLALEENQRYSRVYIDSKQKQKKFLLIFKVLIRSIRTTSMNSVKNIKIGRIYEEGNKETEFKYNDIKENAKLVDDIRAEIRELEDKKRGLKLTISTSHSKAKEVEGFIKSTFDPLKGYLTESDKIGARVKASIKKKDDYAKLKENINIAVLEVLGEVELSNKERSTC